MSTHTGDAEPSDDEVLQAAIERNLAHLRNERSRAHAKRTKAQLIELLLQREDRIDEMLESLQGIESQVREVQKILPGVREELNQSRQWGKEVQGRLYDEQNAHANTRSLLAAAEAEAVELAGEKRALLKALVAATVD